MFRQKKNYYSNYGYYFITAGTGGPDFPVSGDLDPPQVPGYITSEYDCYTSHEIEDKSFKDNVTGMRTGKEWFGENFTIITEQTFNFTLPGLIKNKSLNILTQLL